MALLTDHLKNPGLGVEPSSAARTKPLYMGHLLYQQIGRAHV